MIPGRPAMAVVSILRWATYVRRALHYGAGVVACGFSVLQGVFLIKSSGVPVGKLSGARRSAFSQELPNSRSVRVGVAFALVGGGGLYGLGEEDDYDDLHD